MSEIIISGDLVSHRGIKLEIIVSDTRPHIEPPPTDIRKVDFLHHIEIGHLIVTGTKLELITVSPLEKKRGIQSRPLRRHQIEMGLAIRICTHLSGKIDCRSLKPVDIQTEIQQHRDNLL